MSMPSLLEALNMGGAAPAPPPGMPPPPPGGLGGAGMGSLLGMLPPPVSQASVYAQALSGGISAMRGTPDPVQAIVRDQQQQQNAISAMLMRMSEQQRQAAQWGADYSLRQTAEARREQHDLFNEKNIEDTKKRQFQIDQLAMNKELMDAATTDDTRKIMAEKRAKMMEQFTGQATPPEIIGEWATKKFDEKEVQAIVRAYAGLGVDNPDAPRIVAEQFGISPAKAAYYQTVSQKDAYRKAYGVMTTAEQEKEISDAATSKANAWVATNPQFKDTNHLQGLTGFGDEFVQRIAGKSLYSLNPANPQDAVLIGQAQKYAVEMATKAQAIEDKRKLAEKQAESNIIQQREINVAGAKQAMQPPKLNDLQLTRLTKPLDVAQDMTTFKGMRDAAQGLADSGLLPTNQYLWEKGRAAFQQWWNSNDSNLLMFKQLTTPQMIGRVDRFLYDEKNVRVAAAFKQQLALTSSIPTLENINKLIGFYEHMFGAKAAEQMRMLESQRGKIDPDVMDYSRELFRQNFPNGVPPDPTLGASGTPLNPKPVGIYDPATDTLIPAR